MFYQNKDIVSAAKQICAVDHSICNHISRKVLKSGSRNLVQEIWFKKSDSSKMVLQTWIFFKVWEKWLTRKKLGWYYKSTFFFRLEKSGSAISDFLSGSRIIRIIRVWKTTFLEPLFYTFPEKWLQIKWLSGPPGFNISTWSLFDGTKNLFLTNMRNTFSAQ